MDGHGDDGQGRELFQRPLFRDPASGRMLRVGVVDIGSNSVRLVVFDGAARSPAYFFNEKIMAGLGAGMAETGRLNPEGKVRALAAMKRFQLLAEGMGIGALTAVATAAMREAEDGPAFRREIEDKTGLKVWVIDGEEEARLSAQGVLLGWPGAYGLVSDIGGSSMELAELRDGRVGKKVSAKLGPLRLAELGSDKAVKKHLKKEMSALRERMGEQSDRLFLVGGSWRAIARIDMIRRDYPLAVLHEYRMTREDAAATIEMIQSSDMEELRLKAGLGEARAALVPLASLVLSQMLDTFRPRDIAISSYGIREGMLYEQMPASLRDRDPLIEAARFYEQKDARMPGFGTWLYGFLQPLYADAPPHIRRLAHAACLMHDVGWRSHPDYRHEVTFETATRANLAGMTHKERVMLGVALFHRYKNSRSGSRYDTLFDLLDEEQIRLAEIMGKALRFAAMLSAQTPELMGRLDWDAEARRLTMHLPRGAEAIFGEVVEARFNSLASALDATAEVVRPNGKG